MLQLQHSTIWQNFINAKVLSKGLASLALYFCWLYDLNDVNKMKTILKKFEPFGFYHF